MLPCTTKKNVVANQVVWQIKAKPIPWFRNESSGNNYVTVTSQVVWILLAWTVESGSHTRNLFSHLLSLIFLATTRYFIYKSIFLIGGGVSWGFCHIAVYPSSFPISYPIYWSYLLHLDQVLYILSNKSIPHFTLLLSLPFELHSSFLNFIKSHLIFF